MYKRQTAAGFGKGSAPAAPRSKPLKRPTQARSKFTVQAIYDAFCSDLAGRGVYDELAARWLQAFAACPDLDEQPAPATVHALLTASWGGRRYRLLVEPEPSNGGWVEEMEALVAARLCAKLQGPGARRAGMAPMRAAVEPGRTPR